jgi:Protein of unknown function (Gmx_para_CXXCG)
MRLFELKPDETQRGKEYDYHFDASHKWCLPAVRCPIHGPWGIVGVSYPAVDLSGLPEEERYRDIWPVAVEEFEALRGPIVPLMPDGSVPLPGTEFGPLVGDASGTFGDFSWPALWLPLIRREALERLLEMGVRSMVGAPTKLTFKAREVPDEYERSFTPAYWAGTEPVRIETEPADLLELQIEPHVQFAAASLPDDGAPPCPVCGRRAISRPDRIIINRSSVPERMDLFRARDLPTLILGTERFADAVRALQLTGIALEEVEVTS